VLVEYAADDEGLDEAGACRVGVNMMPLVACVVLAIVIVGVRIADDSVRSVTTL
jgi:hypothetical protein